MRLKVEGYPGLESVFAYRLDGVHSYPSGDGGRKLLDGLN